MTINSRQKGARGERELAQWLREYGLDARRGQQFSGSPDSPDVVHSMEGLHIECKRVETFNAYKALEQAEEDCGADTPVVFHKRNRKDWIVVLGADDFMRLLGYELDAIEETE